MVCPARRTLGHQKGESEVDSKESDDADVLFHEQGRTPRGVELQPFAAEPESSLRRSRASGMPHRRLDAEGETIPGLILSNDPNMVCRNEPFCSGGGGEGVGKEKEEEEGSGEAEKEEEQESVEGETAGKKKTEEAKGFENDWGLFLPTWIDASERSQIQAKLEGHVATLKNALRPKDLSRLREALRSALGLNGRLRGKLMRGEVQVQGRRRKRMCLRCVWAAPDSIPWGDEEPPIRLDDLPFIPIICVSASPPEDSANLARRGWHYVQGAGDDEEGWSRGLTPRVFWRSVEGRLRPESVPSEVEKLVDGAVARAKVPGEGKERKRSSEYRSQEGGEVKNHLFINGKVLPVAQTGICIGCVDKGQLSMIQCDSPGANDTSSDGGRGKDSASCLRTCLSEYASIGGFQLVIICSDSSPEKPSHEGGRILEVLIADGKKKGSKDSLERSLPLILHAARTRISTNQRESKILIVGNHKLDESSQGHRINDLNGGKSMDVCVCVAAAICLLDSFDENFDRVDASKSAGRLVTSKQRIKLALNFVRQHAASESHPSRHLVKQMNKFFLS